MASKKQDRRVTMVDIARETGVTAATVSMALRNHRRISRATIARVQDAARRLGYRPNPLVAALMAQLHGKRRTDESPTLAYLNTTGVFPHSQAFSTLARYYKGASARARDLGFHLEEFWLREPGMTSTRMERILASRGISGIIVATPESSVSHLDFNVTSFAVCAIDRIYERPAVHGVRANHFQHMWLALEKTNAYGYRRIGLAMSQSADAYVSHAWLSAYLGWCHIHERPGPPPFVVQAWTRETGAPFGAWLRQHRPDAVIVSEADMYSRLADADYRVPDEIGLVHLAYDCEPEPCAGIDQNSEQVGAAAVDHVVSQLHRNERNLPATPQTITVDGRWVDGPSLPDRRRE